MAISNEMGEYVDGDCVDVDRDGDDCENEDATNMRPRGYHCRVSLAEWHCYSPVVSTVPFWSPPCGMTLSLVCGVE